MIFGEGLHLTDGGLEIDIREFIRSFTHVLESEVIGFEELEVIDTKLDNASNLEVSIHQVSAFILVIVFFPLKEFASPDT